MKNLANIITTLRIVFAAAMLFASPFSLFFWIFYLGAGISDILDGAIARALKQKSDFGAKFDSVADLIFAVAIAAVILINMTIPLWLWLCIAVIAALRCTAYGIGYRKYRTFSALHTYANKTAGGAIFMFPVFYVLLGMEISGGLLCVVTFLSAFEELWITMRSKKLNRNCKSIFLN